MTQHINEKVRQREEAVKLYELARQWGRDRVPPSARFVHEGALVKLSRAGKARSYQFLLLASALSYGRRDDFSSRVSHHRTLLLKFCQVRDGLTSGEGQGHLSQGQGQGQGEGEGEGGEEGHFGFVVVGREKSIRLCAASAADKGEWMRKLRSCIEAAVSADAAAVAAARPGGGALTLMPTLSSVAAHEAQQTAPVWQQDRSDCGRCGARFSLLVRRHHCRCCGRCLCDKCTPNRLVLAFVDGDAPQRVCRDCA